MIRASAAEGKTTGYRDSVGFFIPLPKDLARQFPSLAPEDNSPSHCTFLFVGTVPESREGEFIEVCERILRDLPQKVTATLGPLDHFIHHDKDRAVAHVQVKFSQDMDWQRLHLVNGLRQAGFDVSDSWRQYKPHVTLKYMPGTDSRWTAPVPRGSWDFSSLEVWGLPKKHVVRFGVGAGDMAREVAAAYTKQAALANTETASFVALDPASLVGLFDNYSAEEMHTLHKSFGDHGVSGLESVVRSVGGAVFHTGGDGEYDIRVDTGDNEWGLPREYDRLPYPREVLEPPFLVEPKALAQFFEALTGFDLSEHYENQDHTDVAKYAAGKYKEKVENPKGGKPIYKYGPRQVSERNKRKAEKVEKLRKNIGKLRKQVRRDLGSSDDKTKALALAVALMDETYERVGNEGSAKDGHFGVTGWRVKHVSFKGNKATLSYVGKSGVRHTKEVKDKKLVSLLKKMVEGKEAGDHLITCGGDDGPQCVKGSEVNDYLKDHDITAKDIRGYHANREMVESLKAIRKDGPELPHGRKEKDEILKKEMEKALKEVAKAVGHEPSTLKSNYLVPNLVDSFLHDGTVVEKFKKATKDTAEKEDEESERLVRQSPKKKPPRKDKRRERIKVEDPDIDTGDRGDDKDLSLNYKRVGSEFPRSFAYTGAIISGEVSRNSKRHPCVSAGHTIHRSTTMPKMTVKGAFQVIASLQRQAALFQDVMANVEGMPRDVALDYARRCDMLSDHFEEMIGIRRNASGEVVEGHALLNQYNKFASAHYAKLAKLPPSVPEKDGWDPTQIAEQVSGPHEGDADEKAYMGDNFTQQEYSELRSKQEAGKLPQAEFHEASMKLGFDLF